MATPIQQFLAERDKPQNNTNAASTGSANNSTSSPSTSSSTSSASYNGSYFSSKTTEAEGDSAQRKISSLQEILERRNEEEKSESVIHGMSDAEYEEYREFMLSEYGIQLERGYNYGHFQNVAVAMGESCSQGTRFSAQCKAAQSYDSVLDLVLDAKLTAAIADIFNGDTDPNWDRLCSSGNAGRLLTEYGIKIVKCADRQWSVSLVDENGDVIKDADGNLAQVYKNDYLLPDGQAQQNEVQLGAALDAMGFDCWSVLDLSKEEYEMVKQLAGMKNSELGTSSGISGGDERKIRDLVLGTYDNATKTWSKAKKQDNSAWTNKDLKNAYLDKVTGKRMNAKTRYNQFTRDRDAGLYKGKHSAELSGNADYGYAYKNNGEFIQEIGVIGAGSLLGAFSKYLDLQYYAEYSGKEYVTLLEFDRKVKEVMKEKGCTKEEAAREVKKKYVTFRDEQYFR